MNISDCDFAKCLMCESRKLKIFDGKVICMDCNMPYNLDLPEEEYTINDEGYFTLLDPLTGGVVNKFCNELEVTLSIKHSNPDVVVDHTLVPSLIAMLNGNFKDMEYTLKNVKLIDQVPFKDLELKL